MKRSETRFRPARDQKQQGTEEKDQAMLLLPDVSKRQAGVKSTKRRIHSLFAKFHELLLTTRSASDTVFQWLLAGSAPPNGLPLSLGHNSSSKPPANPHGSHSSLHGLRSCSPSRLDNLLEPWMQRYFSHRAPWKVWAVPSLPEGSSV